MKPVLFYLSLQATPSLDEFVVINYLCGPKIRNIPDKTDSMSDVFRIFLNGTSTITKVYDGAGHL
jgi:hypothetical protein